MVEFIASLTEKIKDYDQRIEALVTQRYPQASLLQQVVGVGALTALSFVLTLEDPQRFRQSRAVGAYLGLAPGNDQSGDSDPQKRISREGDEMLRRLLVGSAQHILGMSWAHSAQTPTSGVRERRSPGVVAARTPGSGQ